MCQGQYRRELDRPQLPTIWKIPDKMCQKVRPLLPSEKEPGTPGRPPLPFGKGLRREEADELLESLGYTGHIKRRGEKEALKGVGEPLYLARRWKAERSVWWLNHMRKLRVRWEKIGTELPWAVVVSRCAHHLPTDSFGVGSN